jgi:DNA (cytosine-5)-methyltransferase 1
MAPRPIHPFSDRVISAREAARLHSFPDWFRFHSTKWHGFRQIGNALPPLLGRAIGAQIVDVLGLTPEKPAERLGLGDVTLLGLPTSVAANHFGVDIDSIPSHKRRTRRARPLSAEPCPRVA